MSDFVNDFMERMLSFGLNPNEIIPDAQIHRFQVGDKKNQDGWYFFVSDGNTAGGAFGDWKTVDEKWFSKTNGNAVYTADIQKKLRERKVEQEAEQQKKWLAASQESGRVWSNAKECHSHNYLERKRIKSYGLRVDTDLNLLIPLHDIDLEIWSIQKIKSTGKFWHGSDKDFLSGGKKKSCHFRINADNDKPVIFCEGYATGATIHEILNQTVICCMDAGNIESVIKVYREKSPVKDFWIAADNDQFTPGNPGISKAKTAAAKYNCKVFSPEFRDITTKPTDFNDLYRIEGAEAVISFFQDIPKTKSISDFCKEILQKRDPCGQFDINTLPPLLRDYASQKIQEINAEPVQIVSSIISMLSAMVGKRAYIPKGIHYEDLFVNLWSLTIAPSGGGKSTAQRSGTEILNFYEVKIQKEIVKYREEIFQLSQDRIIEKGQQKQELDKKISEIQTEIERLEGKSLFLPSRGSMEGLLESMIHSKGGLVNISEFGAWMKNLGRDFNSGAKEILTDLYDCDKFSPKTRTKSGGIMPRIEHPYISINAISTLEWVKNNIQADKDVSSGFFARFLLFYPPQTRRRGAALPEKREKNEMLMNEIIDLLDNFRRKHEEIPLLYDFEDAARDIFKDFYDFLFDAVEDIPEAGKNILHPYINRWTATTAKLSMLFQIFCGGGAKISAESMLSSIAIIEYAMKSTVYLLQNDLGETTPQENLRKAFEYIAKRDGCIKYGQLLVAKVIKTTENTKNVSMECLNVLESLEDMGKILIDRKPNNRKEWIITINTGS